MTIGPNFDMIRFKYVRNSPVMGAILLLLYCENNTFHLNKSRIIPMARNEYSENDHHQLPHMSNNKYVAVVYVVEDNGLLKSGIIYPATNQSINVNGKDAGIIYIMKVENVLIIFLWTGVMEDLSMPDQCYSISNKNLTITLSRKCPDGRDIQVFFMLNNPLSVHKLHVGKSDNPDDPVTVTVEQAGFYLVAVFTVEENRGIMHSRASYVTEYELVLDKKNHQEDSSGVIAGIVVAALVVVVVLVITFLVILLLVIKHCKLTTTVPLMFSNKVVSEDAGGNDNKDDEEKASEL